MPLVVIGARSFPSGGSVVAAVVWGISVAVVVVGVGVVGVGFRSTALASSTPEGSEM